MKKPAIPSSGSLIIEIIDVLEECGIDDEAYTLYEYIDLDVLGTIISSGDASIEVRIIHG